MNCSDWLLPMRWWQVSKLQHHNFVSYLIGNSAVKTVHHIVGDSSILYVQKNKNNQMIAWNIRSSWMCMEA